MTKAEKQATIDKAVNWIIDTANSKEHGYDLKHPTGPDYKCSTLVFFGWHHAGAGTLKDKPTTQKKWMAGTGQLDGKKKKDKDFTNVTKKVNLNDCNTLKRGDILMHGHTHTAQYIGDCKLAEATKNYDGKQGDSSGKEISIKKYKRRSWSIVWRYDPKIDGKSSSSGSNSTSRSDESVSSRKKTQTTQQRTQNSSAKKAETSKPYESYKPEKIVRDNLDCGGADLTDLEKYYCAYSPVSGGEKQLQNVTMNVISTVYTWIGIVAVIVIVIGGVRYMVSAGNPQKIQSAQKTILYAVIGLIVTLAAFAITNFVIAALG